MNTSHPGVAPRENTLAQGRAPRPAETPQQRALPQRRTSRQQENPQPNKDTQPDESSKEEQDSLKAWAGIEGETKKDDEGTMEGHIKDVDTLLVFAGLFSAVLTAFAVESYKQLQPDNDEISTKILRRISIQLESFTLSPGFANSTLPALPLPSLDFIAETTARWVNIMWFLSLIFSLAAALFGIFVKQWIREYMQWNAALAHPRDNILVRQIRYEAWHDWNVPATIAAVPALLEIALVFFICGLVILLWTLDPVVSLVITTAASTFLAIAATFTVLPAFFRRCPYKSPTAWAFAVFWDFLTRYIPHTLLLPLQQSLGHWIYWNWSSRRTGQLGEWLMKTSGLSDDHPRIGNWTAFAHDWRGRDLANLWSSLWPGTKRGDAIPLLKELRLERAGLPTDFDTRGSPSPSILPAIFHTAQRTITELTPLIRALAWVSQASQDARTQNYILSCVESLETRFALPHDLSTNKNFISQFFDEDGVRAASYWNLTLDLMRRNARTIRKKPEAQERKNMSALLANFKLVKHAFWGYTHMEADWTISLDGDSPAIPVFAHLLALSVRTLSRTLSNPRVPSETFERLRPRNVLRLRQYLSVLRYFYFQCERSMPNMGDHLCDTFVEMVYQEARSLMPLFPDWQSAMLRVIHGHDSARLKKLMDELEIRGWPANPGNVSKITRALTSDHTISHGIRPHPATEDPFKANSRTAEPTDDPSQMPPTQDVLRPTSALKLQYRSATFPPAIQPSPRQSSRHWSLYPPQPPRLFTCALENLRRAAEASQNGELSQPSAVLAEGEHGLMNDLVRISSSHPGSHRLVSSTAPSSHPDGPAAGASQSEPSSSYLACPSSSPPSHCLLYDEWPPPPSGTVAEEKRKAAATASIPSRSLSRPSSSKHKHIGPTVPLPGPSALHTTGLPSPSPSLSPILVSIEPPNRRDSTLGGFDGVGESGYLLHGQPQNKELPESTVFVDEEQKIVPSDLETSATGESHSHLEGKNDSHSGFGTPPGKERGATTKTTGMEA